MALKVLACLIPPLGVFLSRGISPIFWVSVLLTLIAYVPGLILALFIVLQDEGQLGRR